MATDAVTTQKTKTLQEIIDASQKSTSNRGAKELGKDDFLKLMVTQLKYQDPLKPTEDKDFIGQMAQFSSLEQMQNLNTTFSANKAFGMIGKQVTATIEDKNGTSKEVTGEVTNVKMKDGNVYIVVNNQELLVDKVSQVSEATEQQNSDLTKYMDLISRHVESTIGENIKLTGIVGTVESDTAGKWARVDSIDVQISDVLSGIKSTDPDFKSKYLEANKGKSIKVEIVDSKSGNKAQIEGVLSDYVISSSGSIAGKFNDVKLPIDSIQKIGEPYESVV